MMQHSCDGVVFSPVTHMDTVSYLFLIKDAFSLTLAVLLLRLSSPSSRLLKGFKDIEGIKGFAPQWPPCAPLLLRLLVSPVEALLFLPSCASD